MTKEGNEGKLASFNFFMKKTTQKRKLCSFSERSGLTSPDRPEKNKTFLTGNSRLEPDVGRKAGTRCRPVTMALAKHFFKRMGRGSWEPSQSVNQSTSQPHQWQGSRLGEDLAKTFCMENENLLCRGQEKLLPGATSAGPDWHRRPG